MKIVLIPSSLNEATWPVDSYENEKRNFPLASPRSFPSPPGEENEEIGREERA